MTQKKEITSRTITRQAELISNLTQKIKALEIDNQAKDEIISVIDSLREQMIDVVEELKEKSRKYDELIGQLLDMKAVMNEYVFDRKSRKKTK